MSDEEFINEVEAGYERRPPAGYDSHNHKSRATREKTYENPLQLKALVKDPEFAQEQEDALTLAYQVLYDARLLESKTQFAAAMLQAYKTPIPLAEAASICQVSRQYFRKLEKAGRIKILRSTRRKNYLYPEDIVRVLESRI